MGGESVACCRDPDERLDRSNRSELWELGIAFAAEPRRPRWAAFLFLRSICSNTRRGEKERVSVTLFNEAMADLIHQQGLAPSRLECDMTRTLIGSPSRT